MKFCQAPDEDVEEFTARIQQTMPDDFYNEFPPTKFNDEMAPQCLIPEIHGEQCGHQSELSRQTKLSETRSFIFYRCGAQHARSSEYPHHNTECYNGGRPGSSMPINKIRWSTTKTPNDNRQCR
ncbi:hypothetical protein PHET_05959 [Paragonimus heterotremus]|uniref:Uncharacterized protein n=1 Tax=Paragonimus heterotremus TaxID=100268 RepID=A0A8J4TJZ9_9TREM|nr:hypothetical protein PHET_05959 [Paragonimus heterotremus]